MRERNGVVRKPHRFMVKTTKLLLSCRILKNIETIEFEFPDYIPKFKMLSKDLGIPVKRIRKVVNRNRVRIHLQKKK